MKWIRVKKKKREKETRCVCIYRHGTYHSSHIATEIGDNKCWERESRQVSSDSNFTNGRGRVDSRDTNRQKIRALKADFRRASAAFFERASRLESLPSSALVAISRPRRLASEDRKPLRSRPSELQIPAVIGK